MSPLWRVRIFIIVLALLTAGMGYLYFTHRLSPEQRAQLATPPTPTPTPTLAPDTTVVNFSQLLAVPYDLDADEASEAAMLDFIATNKPGFVTLFGSKIATGSAQDAVGDIFGQISSQERPLIAVDHEGGTVQRLSGTGFTRLPTWKRMCDQTQDVRAAELATSAAELRKVGVSVVFAPVVDVADSNIVLRDRVCSGDPEEVSTAAIDFIQAFQNQHILPVLKHYPGLGSAQIDTHNQRGTVTITDKDTLPFKKILDTYPSLGVMSAHIVVENQGIDQPCSLSFTCIGQLFDLYPDVVVFSDALEMKAALYNSKKPDTPKTLETAAIEAIQAGNTVLVFGQDVSAEDVQKVLERIRIEYTSSSDFRDKVNQSVKKIQDLKSHYGLDKTDDESAL